MAIQDSGRRKPPTMRDVAKLAGVSTMTVSNVIRRNARYYNDETKDRVEEAIAQLGYRVASSGRNLRSGRRNSIGVIIVDESDAFLVHPFISRFVSGLCSELNKRDYNMIVQGLHPSLFGSSFLISRAETDAYCIRLHGGEDARRKMIDVMRRVPEPLVLMEETVAFDREDTCVVRQDDFGGGMLMADHLIGRGVRSVEVIVTRHSGPITAARIGGLREGARKAGAKLRISMIKAMSGSFAAGYDAVAARLDKNASLPDVLLGTNDDLAFAAMRALADRGMAVPDDVRVAGFNGFESPRFTQPSLTTIVSRPEDLGIVAGKSLIERLETGVFASPEIMLPVSFRCGEST
jgi:DNA-binding LacI/PurR family transcriptional regulator